MNLTVIKGDGPEHDKADELAERIKDVIYEFSGRISLATAIGVLHIVAAEILQEAQ